MRVSSWNELASDWTLSIDTIDLLTLTQAKCKSVETPYLFVGLIIYGAILRSDGRFLSGLVVGAIGFSRNVVASTVKKVSTRKLLSFPVPGTKNCSTMPCTTAIAIIIT